MPRRGRGRHVIKAAAGAFATRRSVGAVAVAPRKSERVGESRVESVLVLCTWRGTSPYFLSATVVLVVVIAVVVAVFLLSTLR